MTTGGEDVDPWNTQTPLEELKLAMTMLGDDLVPICEFEHLHALWASSSTSIYIIQRNSYS